MERLHFVRKDNVGNEMWRSGVPLDSPKRMYNVIVSDFVVEVTTNDPDLSNSGKLFHRVVNACTPCVISIEKMFLDKIRDHAHSIKEIKGQIIQKIDGTFPWVDLQGMPFLKQKEELSLGIINNPEKFVDTFLYVQKRLIELDSHMVSFDILHLGEQIELTKLPQNIRRAVLNIWHAFDASSVNTGLSLKFDFDDTQAENCKITLDYKTFDAALYNFFDNAQKYAYPYSEIRIFFVQNQGSFKLIFSMDSLRIEQNELERVFERGFRGKNALTEKGSGIGLYVFKKGLEINGLSSSIEPEYKTSKDYNGKQYIRNKFLIEGPL